jgi:UDP:flavonoid glycosyltransferase YjiC (YdhE family)
MLRLKVGRVIQRGKYTPWRVARKLKQMLAAPLLAERSASVAQQLSHEDGVRTACDALEELYRSSR